MGRLFVGLVLFGLSLALMVEAHLGIGPWDVLHQGLAGRIGVGIGAVVIAVGLVVLALWVPLGERPGLGTVANVVIVGLVTDVALAALPSPSVVSVRAALLVSGILLNGVATGLYISARLGPGPRDGLMTGLARRGVPIAAARTGIELTVLVAGVLLGGEVGVGTVAYAAAIGPLAQHFLAAFDRDPDRARRVRT